MSEADHDDLLTAAQAAARLGVKRQTLYAYVSRGLLHRTVAMDGRTSLFDPREVDRFRTRGSSRDDGELRTLIATAITRVRDDALTVRGHDLIALVEAGASFTEVADLVWQAEAGEVWPQPESSLACEFGGVDGLRSVIAAASQSDPLRHDLSAVGVRSAGRRMVVAMTHGLPTLHRGRQTSPTASAALWQQLSPRAGTAAQRRTLDCALSLLVDHGLASSTFAARIAASVRADPYSVVSTGLGAARGPLHGDSSGAVHRLLAHSDELGDAAVAVGEVLRTGGKVPGFGHTVYQEQDPRYGALIAQVLSAWADDPRLRHIHRLRDVVAERHRVLPNVDLALGALTWIAQMSPDAGATIFAVARTVGWLAHASEEYDEAPLRFRTVARYLGPA